MRALPLSRDEHLVMIPPAKTKKPRDQRLDFFRGICLYFIFIAHTPGNGLIEFIPARFGFSDATEIFVFCSGMASAIAFGGVFVSHGWLTGTGRILYRIWQVYWAHLGVFLIFAALVFGYDLYKGATDAARAVNLHPLLEDPRRAFPALVTMTYLPWFLDILPMYLVILALVPLAVLLKRSSLAACAVISIALWGAAQAGYLAIPGDPWAGAAWYFNPFGWQLLFFLGFAWMQGWIAPPPVERRLVLGAAALTLITVPFATLRLSELWGPLQAAADFLFLFQDKGSLGPLRLAHFMAIAYLAYAACGEGGRNLRGGFVALMRKTGTQSLPVFLSGVILSRAVTFLYQEFGTGLAQDLIFNALAFAAIIAVVTIAAWFRGEPWSKPPAAGEARGSAGIAAEAEFKAG